MEYNNIGSCYLSSYKGGATTCVWLNEANKWGVNRVVQMSLDEYLHYMAWKANKEINPIWEFFWSENTK